MIIPFHHLGAGVVDDTQGDLATLRDRERTALPVEQAGSVVLVDLRSKRWRRSRIGDMQPVDRDDYAVGRESTNERQAEPYGLRRPASRSPLAPRQNPCDPSNHPVDRAMGCMGVYLDGVSALRRDRERQPAILRMDDRCNA